MPKKSKAHRASVRNLLSHSKTPSAPLVAETSIHDTLDTSPKPPTTPCGQSHTQEIHAPFDPNLIEIIGRFDDLENDFPDLYGPAETDEEDEQDDTEIQEISVLEHFTEVLQKAQQAATAAEREREKSNKRPHQYDGTSKRSRRRHDLTRRELGKQGFISVTDFWARKKKAEPESVPQTDPVQVVEEAEYIPSDDENDIEVIEEAASDKNAKVSLIFLTEI